uniref:Uncharacterized protein n=1 Tax=Tanacetum cinerariifolium TaxID=118510 RepID=A0A6L2KXL5_TANCI|nr:hypothetical protein [Tanacetum cinerariifolium]
MFDRAFKRVNTFEPISLELVQGKEKSVGEEITQERSKKKKVDDDKETAELKKLMRIIPKEEEVAIDVIPLAIKSLKIVDESNLKCIRTLDKELETLKEEKDVVDGKLACLLKFLKDLESLIKSQRPEKIKDGLGYNVIPPPAADLYLSPKKDLSWTGLPEFADNTITDYSRPAPTVESTSEEGQNKNSSTSEGVASPITPKYFVKFVKPNDCQSERKGYKWRQLGLKIMLMDIIGRCSEDKKKQRNKKLEDSEAEHQV